MTGLLVCGGGIAQGSGAASPPGDTGAKAAPVAADSDTAPKARVLKGGLKKDAAPDAKDAEKDAEKSDGAAPAATGKDTAATFKIEGDTVSLKSGKQLRGVKVLRITPSMIEVEYAPGQPVMKIPRKMVTKIEYENPANAPEVTAAGPEKAGGGDVMVAEEISAEFNKKLTAPLPGTPLEFKDQDALAILKDLADRAQVTLAVDPEAQKVPEAQRKMTLSVPATATLSTLLREEFRNAVPALRFSLQFDKILVASVEAENLKATGSLPPGLAPKNTAPAK